MKLYKLTRQDNTTYGGTLWGEGIPHSIPKGKRNPVLCSSGVLHAYKNVNLALLINPIQANISNPKIWAAKGKIVVEDWGKCACYKLTTIKELELPKWFTDVKVRKKVQIQFAILCAEQVLCLYEEKYPEDLRPRKAIQAAKDYLSDKTTAARAAYAAAYAAVDAADAAYAAARAADAAYAAVDAADAAAYAARAAVGINFCLLADKAIKLVTGD